MLQSKLFTRTTKESPKDEVSINAQLLERAGYVQKTLSGVYSFLPLGLKVLRKVEDIIRHEMDALSGQELFLPALHPKENWMQTGRWDGFDALFKIRSRYEYEYALGATHEEIIVPVVKKYVKSYRDLPFAAYQIQTKFRDEPRAKSGLLRGREFRMKDMYSFHASMEDLDAYYEKVQQGYATIFSRLTLAGILTLASGGSFSKYSHEFQVETPTGEDTIFYCKNCDTAINKEIADETHSCPQCHTSGEEKHTSEVGNIFKLYTKYSEPFNLTFMNEQGGTDVVLMGCYGIGTSRLVGTLVEIFHDAKGLRWPVTVAPYHIHLVPIVGKDAQMRKELEAQYRTAQEHLVRAGYEVLLDDRSDLTAGERFADSDLIGLPIRIIFSERNHKEKKAEIVVRMTGQTHIAPYHSLIQTIQDMLPWEKSSLAV
ncbi:hypothetical protein HY621_00210 [Candidatus Uhrbacteria bacterium]|nr:hypothetical protein [Candidatus Uhrbacteria bacterium]